MVKGITLIGFMLAGLTINNKPKPMADHTFSEDKLERIAKDFGIMHPEVVVAQAKLETGNFTSKVFIENHNLFGMKLARQRETTAIGEQYNHARYISWVQSLMDYKLWQDKYASKFKTRRAYLKYLSENYAQDKKYIHKLKQML